jgi:hypothetical protein
MRKKETARQILWRRLRTGLMIISVVITGAAIAIVVFESVTNRSSGIHIVDRLSHDVSANQGLSGLSGFLFFSLSTVMSW